MADLSKCNGRNCRVKKECYRFTAPVNEFWQSWIEPPNKDFYNGDDKIEICELFIRDKK